MEVTVSGQNVVIELGQDYDVILNPGVAGGESNLVQVNLNYSGDPSNKRTNLRVMNADTVNNLSVAVQTPDGQNRTTLTCTPQSIEFWCVIGLDPVAAAINGTNSILLNQIV